MANKFNKKTWILSKPKICIPPPPPPPPLSPGIPGLLFRDTFTGDTGNNLDTHTPDVDIPATGWTQANGLFKLTGTRAEKSGSPTNYSHLAYTTIGQWGIRMDNWCNTGTSSLYVGIAFRWVATNNFYFCGINPVVKDIRFMHVTPSTWKLVNTWSEPSLRANEDRQITVWRGTLGVHCQLDGSGVHAMSGSPADDYPNCGLFSQNEVAKNHDQFDVWIDAGP
jgi:hypothetical protein